MARYDIYLLLHIIGAIVWLGGGLMFALQSARAEKHLDPAHIQSLLGDVEAFGNRVFAPAALVVLVCGILMVVDGPWSFDQLWLVLALAGFAATFLNGVLFLGPASVAVKKLIERDGGMTDESLTAARRVMAISRADLVLLFSIVFVMVLKPAPGDVLLLALLATAVIGAVAYAVIRVRELQRPDPPVAMGVSGNQTTG